MIWLKAKQLACVSESGQKCPAARSLSLRRAWIEIRSPTRSTTCRPSRSPYGERGLKFRHVFEVAPEHESLSLRRAWIEMSFARSQYHRDPGSLSLRRAWIEMSTWLGSSVYVGSLSLRRAWIEMLSASHSGHGMGRSLSLRRAWIEICCHRAGCTPVPVALLTESVD